MFDLQRFRRLLAVHWAEHGRGYLWFLAIGVAVHFCTWLLVTSGGMDRRSYAMDVQAGLYYAGYLLTSLLFAGRYYAGLVRRESALILLMRPASAFEKFLLAFLFVAVFYPLIYTLAFQICNLPGAWLGEAAKEAYLRDAPAAQLSSYVRQMEYGPFLPFAGKTSPWPELDLFLGAAALQALVLAGALYFRRAAWLKTLVALFALLVIAIPLLAVMTGASPDYLFWNVSGVGVSPVLLAWKWTLWIAVPALFWTSTFFLLRERELQ